MRSARSMKATASMVAGRVEKDALSTAKKKAPSDMYAYECLLRGLEHHRLGGVTKEDAEQGYHWIDMAIQKDPEYGRAYAWRACALSAIDVWTGEDHWDECLADSSRAVELDDREPDGHRILGVFAVYTEDYDKAEFHFQRAIDLNPNSPWLWGRMGDLYVFLGDAQKALDYIEQAKSLDPFLPVYIREIEAAAYYVLGNFQEAVSVVSQCLHKSIRSLAYLVAALTHLENEPAVSAAVKDLLTTRPDFTVNNFMKTEFYRDGRISDQLAGDLVKAGLK